MTMQRLQRKYSIFLSMTTRGQLDGVRRTLAERTIQCGHIPITMELWPSAPQPVRDVIRAAVARCDLFVIVVGTNPGTKCEVEQKWYTQIEFEEAKRLGKPILAFLLDSAEDNNNGDSTGTSETETSPKAAFERFRDDVGNSELRTVKRFEVNQRGEAPPELQVEFMQAVSSFAASASQGGWLHESDVREAIELNATIRSNVFFTSFVDRLKAFPTLSERTFDGMEEKQRIGEFFWDRYLARLTSWGFNRLFFESGSTLAYVGREFLTRLETRYLQEHVRAAKRSSPAVSRIPFDQEFRIYTNNILIYLEVAMAPFQSYPLRIKRLPIGPADPKYGATFGEMTSLVEVLPGDFKRSLRKNEERFVAELARNLDYKIGKKGLILMAASGLNFADDTVVEGPHVGSFYNMLVKRAILRARKPTVLFVHSKKIPSKAEQGHDPAHCFVVCDSKTGRWKSIVKKHPFAVVVSARGREQAISIWHQLQGSGFDYFECNNPGLEGPNGTSEEKQPDAQEIFVLIATNMQFRATFTSHSARSK